MREALLTALEQHEGEIHRRVENAIDKTLRRLVASHANRKH
jgi:hypothetical protein